MQYAILVYETPTDFETRNDPDKNGPYIGAYTAYSQALRESGVAAGGAPLSDPSYTTTLRLRDGVRQVQDGPFSETREQLGGFFLIEVPDLDAALKWAERCPAAQSGLVEVRPVLSMRPSEP